MKYYYVPSYVSIYFPLYSFLKKDKFMVITPNKQIKDFLDFLNVKNYYIKNNHKYNYKEYFKILNDLKSLNIKNNDKFYFFHNGFDIFGFFIMKKINSLKYFYDLDPKRDFINIDFNIDFFKYFIKKFLIKILLGIDLSIFKISNYSFGIKKKFLAKNNIVYIEKSKRKYKKIKMIVLEELNISHKKISNILYISQGLLNKNIIKNYSLIKLDEYMKKINIDIKPHPNDKKILLEKNIINQKIPAELIIKNYKVIVSIYSSSLFIAEIFPEIKFISLINIVKWVDNKYKKKVTELLLSYNKNNNIYFPNNYKEFLFFIKKWRS